MYLNQYWKDERLAFSSEENKVLTLSGDFAEKIWVPDTFFANDKKRFVLKSTRGAGEKLGYPLTTKSQCLAAKVPIVQWSRNRDTYFYTLCFLCG